MKSKAPLMLIEQIMLLLVFAFVAALCMQAFVKSDKIAAQSEARDRAVVLAQTAAETIRHNGGDFAGSAEDLGGMITDEDMLQIAYDSEWNRTDMVEHSDYLLCAQRSDAGVQGLGKARVWVAHCGDSAQQRGEADDLFSIEITWQEVGGNAQD